MKQPEFIFECRKCPAIKEVIQRGDWTYSYPVKKYMCIIFYNNKTTQIYYQKLKLLNDNTIGLGDTQYFTDKQLRLELAAITKDFTEHNNGDSDDLKNLDRKTREAFAAFINANNGKE